MILNKHSIICFGFVENNVDPLKVGRCQVRLIGYHTNDTNQIPSDELYWCQSINPPNLSVINPPSIGSQVICISLDDTFQNVLILGVINGISDETEEPDSSKLARNENIEDTIVYTKNDNKYSGEFDEPDSTDSYGTIYPYNFVYEGLGGNVFEIDDTDGYKRINLFHASGSYIEIINNGDFIIKSVNDGYIITDNLNISGSILIDGDVDIFGNVDINGTITVSDGADITGNTSIDGDLTVDGTITATGDITAFSDKRFKTNIKNINDSLDKVSSLQGVTFNTIFDDKKHCGLIAQDVEKIIPEVVLENSDGYKSIAYSNLVSYLIESIKELKTEIKLLKNGITK